MNESIVKLNEEFIKKVQSVFDKYNIDFNYMEYLKESSKNCIELRDWNRNFCRDYIQFKNIKNYNKYKPLKISSDEDIIEIDSGTIDTIWFPSLTKRGIDFDDSHIISSVEDFDEQLHEFFDELDSYLNLYNMKEYKNIIKNVKQKEKELKEKEKECVNFKDKSFKEIERLKEINCDFNVSTKQKDKK